ncbi:2-polyprenylphenol 6-hydroxylase [Candidatus Persebacteraceae bacterium Df01]|uniref:2-polyprenylphenol 6-hydroxylase n=1 Tax=Candidatus Doriopsillibacter californiensis TaxID=2970740 RepID=A0ABT7QKI9_9GAMM|nr:2-polyprenylphenol 6-hydroxylase [Candidatus Persebacteraceae bacterium Df01]
MVIFRALTIFAIAWRFCLDDIVLSRLPYFWSRFWRRWRRSATPPPARLRMALEHLGPIFIKFGQLLSTRPDLLPAEYIVELSRLQDRVPPHSTVEIRASLENALGCTIADVFSEFDEIPLGSASVAQVHRARLQGSGEEVAVKILRPGVRRRIQRDLRLMRSFAWWAQTLLKHGERLHPQEVVEEFARHLGNETQLLREASNCTQIGRNLVSSPFIVAPKVHWPLCRDDVMVMEYLPAIPISNHAALREAGVDFSRLAKNGIELFFTQVFRDSFFHADMHPGNVHVDVQGRFVLLDYGIVGSLTDFDKEYLARNFIAFFNQDYRAVAQMHVDAGWTPPDTPVTAFENDIRAVCEPIFSRPLKEISFGRFLLQMFQVARQYKLELQPQLLLLQKTLLNVEGMGRELAPDINLWDTAKPFLEKWARQQYSTRRVISVLRGQAPDWLAVVNDLPLAARLLLRRAKQESLVNNEAIRLSRSRSRWRTAAISSVIALLVCLSLLLD